MLPCPPIPAARSQCLLELPAQVPVLRKRRGRRHPLAGLLAVGIAAVIAGRGRSPRSGSGPADAGPEVLAALGAARGPAEESTFRRAFAQVSADALDQVLGARNKEGQAPHLVAALADVNVVFGQAARAPISATPASS